MIATSIKTKLPSFCHTQRVRFVGGEGIIRDLKSEAGIWTYLIEMPLGAEPEFGRIGPETMVFFNEADLCAA